MVYYIASFLILCLGIEIIVVIDKMEKLQTVYNSLSQSTKVGFEQLKESNEMDKSTEMSQLFKLLVDDMKAKDDRIEALENAVYNKRHEERIEASVKTLKMNIEANTDTTESLSDKISSVTTQLAESQRENRRLSDKLAAVLEKINNDMDVIKPMVLNTLNVNFALGKSASESSSNRNVYNKGPNAATDGLKSGIWTDSSCTHTNYERNPWWQVDLENQYLIKRVVIKNRKDCCGERLHRLVITVSNDKGTAGEVCGRFEGPSTSGATVTIYCTNAVYGRFLKIQIQSKNAGYLTLCEVEIFSQ